MHSPTPAGLPTANPRTWTVAALCKAAADLLEARFNPLSVAGEIASFTRAGSGHCYFTLKDEQAQLRCVMFRRGAGFLSFEPREGDRVEARGRLGVYEARGDLQMVVETLRRADGRGMWYEQFLRLKVKLESEGLFDAARKRTPPLMPRGIGVVTSTAAAALGDVLNALHRRVPHIPVILAPASVQGAQAPAELCEALSALYARAQPMGDGEGQIDAILLVRGGGAPEDLIAFNDEALARTICASPVALITGIGHETDFTIADFCADVRAATPTAAAELVARPRDVELTALMVIAHRIQRNLRYRLDAQALRLDHLAARSSRPAAGLRHAADRLQRMRQDLSSLTRARVRAELENLRVHGVRLNALVHQRLERARARQLNAQTRLGLLDPAQVLRRGYAWLENASNGALVFSVVQAEPGQRVRARLVDGLMELSVIEVQGEFGKSTEPESP